MWQRTFSALLFLLALACSLGQAQAQNPSLRLGEIEFFGVGDVSTTSKLPTSTKKRRTAIHQDDLNRLRRALPVKEGDDLRVETVDTLREQIRAAIKSNLGQEPTDLNFLCCDARGQLMIFIGLRGPAFHQFQYLPAPAGSDELPAAILALAGRVNELMSEAVQREPREDRSQGYSLSLYPPLRDVQQQIRSFAVLHAPLITRVLLRSGSALQRRVAAYALGYAKPNAAQVSALARASRDPDNEVRNDATRALGVLAQSNEKIAARIPSGSFIAMLSSGSWSDRNKAAFLLAVLAKSRERALLLRLRQRALPALIEMARWRDLTHASDARLILGRIAGIEEAQLYKLVSDGGAEEIIRLIH